MSELRFVMAQPQQRLDTAVGKFGGDLKRGIVGHGLGE
jgi:hypothetical protein